MEKIFEKIVNEIEKFLKKENKKSKDGLMQITAIQKFIITLKLSNIR